MITCTEANSNRFMAIYTEAQGIQDSGPGYCCTSSWHITQGHIPDRKVCCACPQLPTSETLRHGLPAPSPLLAAFLSSLACQTSVSALADCCPCETGAEAACTSAILLLRSCWCCQARDGHNAHLLHALFAGAPRPLLPPLSPLPAHRSALW